jgi:hypothetical protein
VAGHGAGWVIPGCVDTRWAGLAEYRNGHDAPVVDVGRVLFIASRDVRRASCSVARLSAGRRRGGSGGSR